MSKRDSLRQYRLRRLALETGEFTASELAALAEVEKSTIEVFLSELRQKVPNGLETHPIKEFRVGRPSARYRLTEEGSRYLVQSNLSIGRELLGAQRAPAVMAAAAGVSPMPKVSPEDNVKEWVTCLGQTAQDALLGGGSVTVCPSRPPTIRFRDKIMPVAEGLAVSVDELYGLIRRILTPWQLERLEARRWTEASYASAAAGSFCLRADWNASEPCLELRGLENRIFTVDDLLLPKGVPDLADSPHGLVLVAGIEGSGRSASIAAMVDHVSKDAGTRVAMIEEPVHYFFPKDNLGVEQTQVAIDAPNFGVGLEGALRKNARVITLSDLGDAPTFSIALEAAERHLVVCRVSAPTPSEAIQKTVNLFPAGEQPQARQRLNRALLGIVLMKAVPSKERGVDVVAGEVMKWRPEVSEVILDPDKTSHIYEAFARYPESLDSFDSSIRKLYAAKRITEETLTKYTCPAEPRVAHHS